MTKNGYERIYERDVRDENGKWVENFDNFVQKLPGTKFDLAFLTAKHAAVEERGEVISELAKRFLNGKYPNLKKEFLNSVVKSYMPKHYSMIREFVSPADLTISRPNQLMEKFLMDLFPGKEPKDCSRLEGVRDWVAEVLIDYLQEVCGDVLYFKDLFASEDLRSSLRRVCESKGYKLTKSDFAVFGGASQGMELSKNQTMLLDFYKSVVEKYIVDYKSHIKKHLNKDQYDQIWTAVEMFLINAEQKLSYVSKVSPEFVKYHAIAKKFFAETKEKAYSSGVSEGRRGEYLTNLKSSFKAIKDLHAQPEDLELFRDFYNKTIRLNEVLSIVDEFGNNFPANYFAVMPVHPVNFSEALRQFLSLQSQMEIIENFDITKVDAAKRLVGKAFGGAERSNTGDKCDTKDALWRYRGMRYETRGKVVDISTDELFDEFASAVENVVAQNQLPASKLCIQTVAKSLSRGRQAINIPEKTIDQAVDKHPKTI